MKNQNHEIVPQKINEIECLNEIVELDLEILEAIVGGVRQDSPCPILTSCDDYLSCFIH